MDIVNIVLVLRSIVGQVLLIFLGDPNKCIDLFKYSFLKRRSIVL